MTHDAEAHEQREDPMAAITALTNDHRRYAPSEARGGRWGSTTTEPQHLPRWARLEPAPAPTTPGRRRREDRERIFRRRRLVAAVLVATLAFAAGIVLALALMSVPAGGSLTPEAREARQTRYVVDHGDTLWTVAHTVAPGEDPRVVVDALADARGTSTILPGDTIVWPVG